MVNKRVSLTVLFLVAFIALIAGIFVAQHVPDKRAVLAEKFQGTLLDHPRPIHDFSLTGIDDKSFDNQSMKGHWTMVFFGFTQCGSICPMTMAELGKMFRILEKKQVSVLPNVVMVSIDPKRDSLTTLDTYVRAFDPHFYGARGRVKAVHRMARELGIVYTKQAAAKGEPRENYNIQHSGAVMLFNPDGDLIAFFTPPIHAEALASDFELLTTSLPDGRG
jgi:protein SCO1/2